MFGIFAASSSIVNYKVHKSFYSIVRCPSYIDLNLCQSATLNLTLDHYPSDLIWTLAQNPTKTIITAPDYNCIVNQT